MQSRMTESRHPRRETISIVVAPSRTGVVRQWEVPERAGRVLLVLCFVLAIGAVAGAVVFARAVQTASRVRALETENASLRMQFARVDELERKLHDLSRQNAKMRLLAGIEEATSGRPAPTQTSPPVGSSAEWIAPHRGPISRGFRASGDRESHPGTDISGAPGAAVVAAADGVVTRAEFDAIYGNCVVLEHAGGYESLYGHADSLFVAEGQRVRAGDSIAALGNTGQSTAPHLHFEIRKDGEPVDPATFVTGYRASRSGQTDK